MEKKEEMASLLLRVKRNEIVWAVLSEFGFVGLEDFLDF